MAVYTCKETKPFYLEKSPFDNLSTFKESGDINGRLSGPENRHPELIIQINHEVRTILTAILGFSQLIRQEGLSCEDRKAYTEHIYQETEHLLKTFNRILELL